MITSNIRDHLLHNVACGNGGAASALCRFPKRKCDWFMIIQRRFDWLLPFMLWWAASSKVEIQYVLFRVDTIVF